MSPGEGDAPEPPSRAEELLHGAMRGAIAAMAMSGMRSLTVNLGIIEETPPRAIVRQRAPTFLRRTRRGRGAAVIELAHWGYGAGGGLAFASLPTSLRRRPWAGPVYGLLVWLGFELAVAPGLGLSQAKQLRAKERTALAVDHLLYGFVLSETRRRPQA